MSSHVLNETSSVIGSVSLISSYEQSSKSLVKDTEPMTGANQKPAVSSEQMIRINASTQEMHCYHGDDLVTIYPVSTGKNGLGEVLGSECTPRGWHVIHSIIGLLHEVNSVFVSRQWTGELYSDELAAQYTGRDWILTRILQLDGLELGRNKGGDVDSLTRYIYIHGTPDTTLLGIPGSRGCVRMRNADIIELANWVKIGSRVCIE